MGGGKARAVETAATIGASLALGGAIGFAAYAGLGERSFALGAAISGLALGLFILAVVGRERPRFAITTFDLGAVHVVRAEPDVLELTEVHQEPLELDDVLVQIGPGSRVVRLFDPKAMPTPGELRQRIDRHLGREVPPAASPDASQALIEALTQLRQSLR